MSGADRQEQIAARNDAWIRSLLRTVRREKPGRDGGADEAGRAADARRVRRSVFHAPETTRTAGDPEQGDGAERT